MQEHIENISTEREENKFDYIAFERLLIKTNLEAYTENLFKSLSHIKSKGINTYFDSSMSSEAELFQHILEKNKERVRLIELLIFLTQNLETKSEVLFKNRDNDSITIDPIIQEILFKALKEEYIKRNYNLTYLSEEEARRDILNLKDIEWIRNYFSNSGFFILRDDLYENYLTKNADDNEFVFILDKDYDIFVDNISPEVIDDESMIYDNQIDIKEPASYIDELAIVEEYINDHIETVDFTLENLNRDLEYYKNDIKKKTTSTPKNLNIYRLIKLLLGFINKSPDFYKNKDVIISRADCRIIHDVLAFFEFIPNINLIPEKERNTTKPENYIRAIFDYHSKKNEIISQQD